ncbi:MAG: class I SAM-dependent methyltransferase [Synergistaceae bacterium]|nr:class I SAM-dependent methyltransferase [Synergistaceae bacterium]
MNHNNDQTRPDQTAIHGLLRRCKDLARKVIHSKTLRRLRYGRLWRNHINLFRNKHGLEIGGPSGIFTPIYDKCASCDGVNFSTDTVWWTKGESSSYTYSGKTLGKMYIADAVDMSCIESSQYDFVMSSNNLEHLANPIKALTEFLRVLKPGGIIVILVPDKRYTFDHRREYTSFEHMLADYENGTQETDLTHLPEILELHDLAMDPPAGDLESFRRRSEHNYENRCLHQHVFCEDSLRKIFAYLGLEVLGFRECFQNYMILGRKV